jgi:hypothetical protein
MINNEGSPAGMRVRVRTLYVLFRRVLDGGEGRTTPVLYSMIAVGLGQSWKVERVTFTSNHEDWT